MARYIDADKLKDRIKASCAFPNIGQDGYFLQDCTIDLIDKQPTADVVEVVRCKDCKHKVDFMSRVMCSRTSQKHGDEYYNLTATDNEHFCAYGERK